MNSMWKLCKKKNLRGCWQIPWKCQIQQSMDHLTNKYRMFSQSLIYLISVFPKIINHSVELGGFQKFGTKSSSFCLSHVLLSLIHTASWFITAYYFNFLLSVHLLAVFLASNIHLYYLNYIYSASTFNVFYCLGFGGFFLYLCFYGLVFLCCFDAKRMSSCGTIKIWPKLNWAKLKIHPFW